MGFWCKNVALDTVKKEGVRRCLWHTHTVQPGWTVAPLKIQLPSTASSKQIFAHAIVRGDYDRVHCDGKQVYTKYVM